MSACLHCDDWGCLRCTASPTTHNPAQRCTTCGSELHASCGTGDHDTAVDLELEALKAERDQLKAALKAARAAWLFEARQGDGILYEHTPVLAQIDEALRGPR